MGAARQFVVLVQSIRRFDGQTGAGWAAEIARDARAILALFQSIYESSTKSHVRDCGKLCPDFQAQLTESRLQLYNKAKEKMDALQARNLSWVEVQFVQRAVDTLTQCRRTLMYTYAFAYFLQKNNQVEIFLVCSLRVRVTVVYDLEYCN